MTREEFKNIYGQDVLSMISEGHVFVDHEILSMRMDDTDTFNGIKLAHVIINIYKSKNNYYYVDCSSWKNDLWTIINNKRLLMLKDDYGDTVAHYLASDGYQFNDPDILSWTNNGGYTVASKKLVYSHIYCSMSKLINKA